MKTEIYLFILSLIFFNCKKEAGSALVETKSSTYTITIEGKIVNKNHIGLDSVRINLETPFRFDTTNINGLFNYSFPNNGIQEVITQLTFMRRSYYDTSFYIEYSPTLNKLSFPEIIMQNVIDTVILIDTIIPSAWTRISGPLGNVTAIAGFGSQLYVGTTNYTGGIYKSTDKGKNWTIINSGLKGYFYSPNTYFINCLAAFGSTIFAGDLSHNGIFRSTNSGEYWTQVNSGIAMIKYLDPIVGPPDRYRDGYAGVNCFGQIGNNIFGSVGSILYRSTNNGVSWDSVLKGNIYAITSDDTKIYAAGNEGVYRSTNNGTNWSIANSGLTGVAVALVLSGKNIYAAGGNGVYLSSNNGKSWNSILSGVSIQKLAVFEKGVFAGTDDIFNGARVYLSTNYGSNWNLVYSQPKNTAVGLVNTHLASLTVFDNCLLVGTDGYGIYRRPIVAILNDLNNQ